MAVSSDQPARRPDRPFGVGPVGVAPQALCELSARLLPVSGAGVSLMTEAGNRGTVSASDDTAAHIEELQFSLGEGPCVDAFTTNAPVLVGDLNDPADAASGRWPGFRDGAGEAGVRAIFAFPLHIGAIRLGVLDLYRDAPGELDLDDLTTALAIADAAALALLRYAADQAPQFTDDDTDRSSYRLEVHQATGMIRVQLGVSIQDAFVRLQAYAFSHARPISEVAADVVARRLRVDTEDE